MPNRHKIPPELLPPKKKFPYFVKPKESDLKSIYKAHSMMMGQENASTSSSSKLAPHQSTKKRTINDVKLDPEEIASIYQLIDETNIRMKQLKEGIQMPQPVGKSRGSLAFASISKSIQSNKHNQTFDTAPTRSSQEDSSSVFRQQSSHKQHRFSRDSSSVKASTFVGKDKKARFSSDTAQYTIPQEEGEIFQSETHYRNNHQSSSSKINSSYQKGHTAQGSVRSSKFSKEHPKQRKLHTRQASADSIVVFGQNSTVKQKSFYGPSIMSPKNLPQPQKAKVTFSQSIKRDYDQQESPHFKDERISSIVTPFTKHARQARQFLSSPQPALKKITEKLSEKKRRSAFNHSHVARDLLQSQGISAFQTTAASGGVFPLNMRRDNNNADFFSSFQEQNTTGKMGNDSFFTQKPATTGVLSRNQIKSPEDLVNSSVISEPKRAKWANDPFSMFVHQTKQLHSKQEKNITNKKWLDPAVVYQENRESEILNAKINGEIDQEESQDQGQGQFASKLQKGGQSTDHIGRKKKKEQKQGNAAIRKANIFKEANIMEKVEALATSTQRLQHVACRGFKTKKKVGDDVLAHDISFRDLVYPKKVNESFLISKFFSQNERSSIQESSVSNVSPIPRYDSNPTPNTDLLKQSQNASLNYKDRSSKNQLRPSSQLKSVSPDISNKGGLIRGSEKSQESSTNLRKSPIETLNKMHRIETLPTGPAAAFSGKSIAMASKSPPSTGAMKQRATPIGGVKIKQTKMKEFMENQSIVRSSPIPGATNPGNSAQIPGVTLLMSGNDFRPPSIAQKTNASTYQGGGGRMNSSTGQFKMKGMTVQVLTKTTNYGFYPSNVGKTLPNELDYRQKSVLRRKVADQVKYIKSEVQNEYENKNLCKIINKLRF